MAKIKTIDITPTWAGLMPALIMAVKNDSEIAKEELMRLAHLVDESNRQSQLKG